MSIVKVVNRKELITNLKLLLASNKNKEVIDGMSIQNHFCFDDKEMFMFDGIIYSSVKYETGVVGGVEISLFLKFLEVLPDDEILLNSTTDSVLTVTGAGSQASFSMISSDEFMKAGIAEREVLQTKELSGDFFNGIKLCLLASSKSFDKYGNLFFLSDETTGNQAGIGSSDSGKSLSFYLLQDKLDKDFMLPVAFCNTLLSISSNFKKCVITTSEAGIMFVFDGVFTLHTFLEDVANTGELIYGVIIDVTSEVEKLELVPKPVELQQILKQANVFSRENLPLEKDSGKVKISVVNNTQGTALYSNDKLTDTFLKFEKSKCVFDIGCLLKALPHVSSIICLDTHKKSNDPNAKDAVISVFYGVSDSFVYVLVETSE